jgi:hypothetical protein
MKILLIIDISSIFILLDIVGAYAVLIKIGP